MKLGICLIFCLFLSISLCAQEYGEIGTSTITGLVPSVSAHAYSWSSFIYNGDSFDRTHLITKLAFRQANHINVTLDDQRIYLKESQLSSFADSHYDDPTSHEYIQVFQGTVSVHFGWVIIDIQDFAFHTSNNLVVLWENRSGSPISDLSWYGTSCNQGLVKNGWSETMFPPENDGFVSPPVLPDLRYYYQVDPYISISPYMFTFPPIAAYTHASQIVNVCNLGSLPMTILHVSCSCYCHCDYTGVIDGGETDTVRICFDPAYENSYTWMFTFSVAEEHDGSPIVQISGNVYSQLTNLSENFDAVEQMPEHWATPIQAQNPLSEIVLDSSSMAYSGTHSLRLTAAAGEPATSKLIAVAPGMTQLSAHVLEFYAKSSTGSGTIVLGHMTDPYNASTFIPVQTFTLTSSYQHFTYQFAPAFYDNYLAFGHGVDNAQGYSINIDDINWVGPELPPNSVQTIYPPFSNNIVLSNVNHHLPQDLSWNSADTATGYLLYFGRSEQFEMINGLDVGNVTHYTLDYPLQYDQSYEWRVIAYNNAGMALNTGIGGFDTTDDPAWELNSSPMLETFDDFSPLDFPLGWEVMNNNGDNIHWTTNYNPNFSHSGNRALHLEAPFNIANDDWVFTRPLHVVGQTLAKLDFWYFIYNYSPVGQIEVKWGNLPLVENMNNTLFTGDQLNTSAWTYHHFEATFNIPANTDAYIGFHALSPAHEIELNIDDVQVSTLTANDDPSLFVMEDGLGLCYPNPFFGEITVPYQLKEAKQVQINLYNVRGQHVRTLVQSQTAKGAYTIKWDALDNQQQPIPQGVYLCQMRAGSRHWSQKIVYLKK